MARILLSNGCSYSIPNVRPKNWKTISASTKKPWYITYRFYDPDLKEKFPTGKYIMLKGMNGYGDLKQRQASTRQILADLHKAFEYDGYNPISETAFAPLRESDYIIAPSAEMHLALPAAMERLTLSDSTMSDIQITLRGFLAAAKALKLDRTPISEIKRRHVIAILDKCAQLNKRWSPARFNKYKANLSMVWKELRQVEAVEVNIIKDIAPAKGIVKKIRETLTMEERRAINVFLHDHYRRFWIFLQCFFHSGARETEMMRLQRHHVDIPRRRIKYLILKGKTYQEKYRPMKEISVPFWEMAMEGCGPDDYIFSKGLEPGAVAIDASQISRRWARHVKGKKESRGAGKHASTIPKLPFPVTADFYSLKHSNLDEVTEQLGLAEAAKLAGHTTTRMVASVYAVGEQSRADERLRQVGNSFA